MFFIPAAILIFWVLIDLWLIKDTPEEADFPHFDTHDASSGQMHIELPTLDLLKKVFASKLMLLIALIGLTSGIFRNGIKQWYFIFAAEVKQPGAEFFKDHWGLLLCVFGIVGGFCRRLGFRQSLSIPPRAARPPCCAACHRADGFDGGVFVFRPLFSVGGCVLVVMASVGLTSLMAGTAATDFGGRKATATCSGIVDGCTYLGSAIQSFSLGYLTTWKLALAGRCS